MLRNILLFIFLFSQLWAQYPEEWTLDVHDYEYTMTITATVEINGNVVTSAGNALAVFYGEECRGVVEPIMVGEGYQYFLLVYSNDPGIELSFKVWDSEVDNAVDMNQTMSFESGGSIGTVGEPFLFTGTNPVSYLDAVNDAVIQYEDDLSPPPVNVLENDIYTDSIGFSLILLDPPVHGQVSGIGDDAFLFISEQNFFGTDSFRYELSNDYGADSAWVYVEVIAVNDPPGDFSLLSPADDVHIVNALQTVLTFGWELPTDVEDDPLTYDLRFNGGAWDTSFALSDNSVDLNIEAFPRNIWLDWNVICFDAWDWTASLDTFQLKIAPLVNVEREGAISRTFSLDQNYPNPFNSTTTMEFNLPGDSYVRIRIYNLRGQRVRTLVNNELSAGYRSVMWNGLDDDEREVKSGSYIVTMETESFREVRKLLLLK